jgi:hypothetical protein
VIAVGIDTTLLQPHFGQLRKLLQWHKLWSPNGPDSNPQVAGSSPAGRAELAAGSFTCSPRLPKAMAGPKPKSAAIRRPARAIPAPFSDCYHTHKGAAIIEAQFSLDRRFLAGRTNGIYH